MSYSHDGYKSRKFYFAVGTVLLAACLVFATKVDSTNWAGVTEAVVAAYLASNVGERWAASKERKDENPG
jgi:hypothetical protein